MFDYGSLVVVCEGKSPIHSFSPQSPGASVKPAKGDRSKSSIPYWAWDKVSVTSKTRSSALPFMLSMDIELMFFVVVIVAKS